MKNPTEKEIERTKRYRREYRQVLGYLGDVAWEWDERRDLNNFLKD